MCYALTKKKKEEEEEEEYRFGIYGFFSVIGD